MSGLISKISAAVKEAADETDSISKTADYNPTESISMAYTTQNFKTKKALKEAVASGRDVRAYNPGVGPDLGNFTGTVYLEGPHYPAAHTWYAQAEMQDGRIVKVK